MTGVKSITLTFGDGPEITPAPFAVDAFCQHSDIPQRMLLGQASDYSAEDAAAFHASIQRRQAAAIQNEAAHIAAVARETGSVQYVADLQELAADLYRYARELAGVGDV